MSQGDYIKKSSFVFIAQIVSFLTGMASGIIIARVLGPEGKGILRLVVLVPAMFALFGKLGIEAANIYFIGKKKYSIQSILHNSVVVTLIISIVFGILYWIFIPQISKLLHFRTERIVVILAYLIVPFTLLGEYLSSVLLGLQKIKTQSLINIVKTISYVVLMAIFIWICHLNIIGGVVANVFMLSINLGLLLYFLRQYITTNLGWDKVLFKESLVFGIKGHLGNIMQFFNYRLDFFIVAFFLNPASVGLYSVAVILAEFVWYIPRSFAVVLFPRTAASSVEESKKFTPLVSRYTILIAMISSLLVLLLGKSLIAIAFGESFLPSLLPLMLLLPGVIFFGLTRILASDLIGRGFPHYNAYASAWSLVITVALDIILIPKMGIAGAAIATSIAYIAGTIITVKYYIKVSGNSLLNITLIRKSDMIMALTFCKGYFANK